MPRRFSSPSRSVSIPVSARMSVVLPWSTWPARAKIIRIDRTGNCTCGNGPWAAMLYISAVTQLEQAAAAARACTLCNDLPLGPRPILRVSKTARLLIVSQAPGTKVHASGVPWTDASGDRLRTWLQMDRDSFYDGDRIAILPMGLCYPGRLPAGGDSPPRPRCAPIWHPRLIPLMPQIRLTLLVGSYAQAGALGKATMTHRVRHFRDYAPRYFPLPHPSWRTGFWEKRNPWFTDEVLPALRTCVKEALSA